MTNNIYDFKVLDINGNDISLTQFQNKVLLIVNTASQCGFTPQYKGLESIYNKYKDRGFIILAFPCNQFGTQEPGNADEIKNFCTLNYSTTFPIFAKIEVNGKNAHPLYEYLKKTLPGILTIEAIKWNFTKFLVDKTGMPVKRFAPSDKPENLTKEIEELLSK